MDKIKRLFPMAFTLKTDLATLIVDIVIHLLFGFAVYIIGDLVISLGTFGIVLCVILRIVNAYILASIVLAILNYCKVIK